MTRIADALRSAPPLPVDAVLAEVRAALAGRGTAVLVAPPGAGKTTRVPLALLETPWVGTGRILVLEPRRLAARAAATQLARLLGEAPGETVGYRVRHDTRVSARTRIEVVTEGILTRMLQDDPTLEGIAAVCFDEFHERHLTTDLGLALALETRALVRPDLRLLVMSATLEPAPVAALLDEASVIVSEGRAFPVEVRWRGEGTDRPLAARVVRAVREALPLTDGDILVFLPGIAELERARQAIDDAALPAPLDVLLLHGGLTLEEQDRVLRRDGHGRRVVLSTAIAESSVTLAEVRVVIDAGLARVPRHNPRSGMTRLETVRVSQASAEQRRGRAGRVAPGWCLRLWDEGTHAALPRRATPEVLEADLTALALDLACAGIDEPTALRWLDAPPAGAFTQGRTLLRALGALDATGRVTAHGRAMAALGLSPRLAHLVIRGAEMGAATLACEVAALLGERDVLRREAAALDVDLRTRVEAVRARTTTADVDRGRLQRVRQEARLLRRTLPVAASDAQDDLAIVGRLVALAFPDRLAQRRPGDAPRFLLRNGRGARVEAPGGVRSSPWLAIADLDGDAQESRVWLAAPLDETDVRAVAGADIVTESEVVWDDTRDAIRASERERLGAIVLRERPRRDVADDELREAMLGVIARGGLARLPWSDGALRTRQRLGFAQTIAPEEFPAIDDVTLLATLGEWLGPALAGHRRLADLTTIDLGGALLDRVPWSARRRLETLAPTHWEAPTGSRLPIDYADPAAPSVAVRLQELFGCAETPRVGEGHVPLTLHLLSPAHRPVQVTRDLAGFWRSSYFEVRKEMKGRYPRHPWPDDPLAAEPTRRAKPRGT
ncbi:MAG: ATP-dependent helicase HrpB [Gemmatimonadota bacterium]|nr:ATP-dependent helicase HrpB [Gemmatimonadota bacterium]MDQ8147582.1 ATP-dependent helicase HrpB [Gemmatimonadota bacterium]MDQ8149474.1 ATP-dependent helicase HrpB [Gemmatimonadota bacterium]MDQ8177171.1 ATP-dependent helicase HrpB [Gemmatimonadota bacterium]